VGSDPGIQDCQTSPKLKGKTLSPLINTDDTESENSVSISNFGNRGSQHSLIFGLLAWTFGDFGNLGLG
jgi:hypothetical protein